MCDAHVINRVRATLSRRAMLMAGTGAAVAVSGTAFAQEPISPLAPAVPLPPPDYASAAAGGVSDLTHTLTRDFPTFANEPGFGAEQIATIAEHGFNIFRLTIDEHTGTHVDAPLHISAAGTSVDLLPAENFVAPLVKIDIAGRAASDPDTMLTPDDVRRWIDDNGPLPERCCVAMDSGWARHVGTPRFRNADAEGRLHFPGFHPETVALLSTESSAVGIAVDTLSLDRGLSTEFEVHVNWLGAGHWGLECVAGLDALPPRGPLMVVGAPKHGGGTGGPARVFALG